MIYFISFPLVMKVIHSFVCITTISDYNWEVERKKQREKDV